MNKEFKQWCDDNGYIETNWGDTSVTQISIAHEAWEAAEQRGIVKGMRAAAEIAEMLEWALGWIDAVPSDTVLPVMPGFDRDAVNETLAILAAVEKEGAEGEVCEWVYDGNEYAPMWNSSCGEAWSFIDGGPEENEMAFCCFCGKPLAEEPATVEE